MNKEQTIANYMKSLNISREEALQLWEDDQKDFIGEAGEEMTKKAKELRRYEKADRPTKEKKPKERKVDNEKKSIIEALAETIKNIGADDVALENELKVHFKLNGNDFTITLTRHKKKKGSV